MFDISKFDYFRFGNIYTGSNGLFNFRIVPDKETMSVQIWIGQLCFQKSEALLTSEFPLSPDGYQSMCDWIESQSLQYSEDSEQYVQGHKSSEK